VIEVQVSVNAKCKAAFESRQVVPDVHRFRQSRPFDHGPARSDDGESAHFTVEEVTRSVIDREDDISIVQERGSSTCLVYLATTRSSHETRPGLPLCLDRIIWPFNAVPLSA